MVKRLVFNEDVAPYSEQEEEAVPKPAAEDMTTPITSEYKQQSYIINLICLNCMEQQLHTISYGVLVQTYRENKPCQNCGCHNTLYPPAPKQ